MTIDIGGRFYTQSDSLSHIAWVKDLVDQGIQRVYLTKHDRKWEIRRMAPLNYVTKDAPWTIGITSFRLEGRPSGLSYEYTSPETMLTKHDLPAFLQGDTVRLTVTVESDSAAWTFLHWGDGNFHQREAFYRMSPTTFVREWPIPTKSSRDPVVLPAAADVISMPSLFGDMLAPYNSCAWVLPYVVMYAQSPDRP